MDFIDRLDHHWASVVSVSPEDATRIVCVVHAADRFSNLAAAITAMIENEEKPDLAWIQEHLQMANYEYSQVRWDNPFND